MTLQERSMNRTGRSVPAGHVRVRTQVRRVQNRTSRTLGEAEDAGDGIPVMLPQTEVVSQPLADILASTGEYRAGDDEWSQSGSAGNECVPGCGRHQSSIQVIWVDVSF